MWRQAVPWGDQPSLGASDLLGSRVTSGDLLLPHSRSEPPPPGSRQAGASRARGGRPHRCQLSLSHYRSKSYCTQDRSMSPCTQDARNPHFGHDCSVSPETHFPAAVGFTKPDVETGEEHFSLVPGCVGRALRGGCDSGTARTAGRAAGREAGSRQVPPCPDGNPCAVLAGRQPSVPYSGGHLIVPPCGGACVCPPVCSPIFLQ